MNNFDEDLDEEIEENSPLDPKEVKTKIPSYSSQKLCEMIVCDRYFGCYQQIAVMCMEELADRRINGDNFDFEDYIERAYNELPQLDIIIPDLGDVLRKLVIGNIGK